MAMLALKNISTSLILFILLSSCQASQEPEVTVHATSNSKIPLVAPIAPLMDTNTQAQELPTLIPDTTADIWLAINRQSADLKKAIANGTVDNVHNQAFAIRDLVAALPSRSAQMSVSEQAKLQNTQRSIVILADRLDESGDANDRASTLENYNKLVTVLNDIAPVR